MDTQKLIARLRERAATQDACGCWSLDRAVADELERLLGALLAATKLSDDMCVRILKLTADVEERDAMLGKMTRTLIEEVNRK